MLPDMGAQDAGGGEGLIAVDTLVRPLATVHPHVLVQTRRLAEALGAHGALVRPVLLVHVQNVDPQPVPLLERPAAQVARKLAVPLVHAPVTKSSSTLLLLLGQSSLYPIHFVIILICLSLYNSSVTGMFLIILHKFM